MLPMCTSLHPNAEVDDSLAGIEHGHDWLTTDWSSEPVNIVMVDYIELAPLVAACIAHSLAR